MKSIWITLLVVSLVDSIKRDKIIGCVYNVDKGPPSVIDGSLCTHHECRVVDEQSIERHFTAIELKALYEFNPDTNKYRPTPQLSKDKLLDNLLLKYREFIVSYHEHDSLLENIPEENMTEEEKMAAWNEYVKERDADSRRKQEERKLYEQNWTEILELKTKLNFL